MVLEAILLFFFFFMFYIIRFALFRLLTFLCDPFHQLVEFIHKHLLLTAHHPGEALLQSLAGASVVPHAAPQLLRRFIPHQSVKLWHALETKHTSTGSSCELGSTWSFPRCITHVEGRPGSPPPV